MKEKFKNTILPRNFLGIIGKQFWQPAQLFGKNPTDFAQSLKKIENVKVYQNLKKYLPQTFPHWTRRKQICQTDAFVRLKVWTVPAWSPEIFEWRKKFTKKKFSQIVPPETKNQFRMTNLTKILTKIPNFYR